MSNDTIEKGHALFAEIFGQEMADGCRSFGESDGEADGGGFGPLQAKWTLEFPYGQVWTRDEQLPRKMRSLAVIGMLIGLRSFDEIKYHTKMGLANGLTRQELEEVFYSALPYCGFPIANTAKAAMLAAFKELDEAGQ